MLLLYLNPCPLCWLIWAVRRPMRSEHQRSPRTNYMFHRSHQLQQCSWIMTSGLFRHCRLPGLVIRWNPLTSKIQFSNHQVIRHFAALAAAQNQHEYDLFNYTSGRWLFVDTILRACLILTIAQIQRKAETCREAPHIRNHRSSRSCSQVRQPIKERHYVVPQIGRRRLQPSV